MIPYEGDGSSAVIPPRRRTPHYHGDEVRVLFVVGALVIIFAQSTGANLPMSTAQAVLASILLIIAAGITSPMLKWIHWVNAAFATLGTLIFGIAAINHARAGLSLLDPSFVYIEALTLLWLVTLYFTMRTIRGLILRTKTL